MKKQITGGLLFRKIQMYKRVNRLALFGLFAIAFLIFGSLTGDIFSGLAFATLIPVSLDKSEFPNGGGLPGGRLGKGGDDDDAPEVLLAKKLTAFEEGQKSLKSDQEALKKMLEDMPDASDKIKALEDALAAKHIEMHNQMKDINQILIAQGTDISHLKNGGLGSNAKDTKSFEEAMMTAFKEKQSEIDIILKAGGKQSGPLRIDFGFQTKAAIDITGLATISAVGSASHYSLTSDTGLVSQIRSRILTYLNSVNVGALSVDKPYAMWIEELDEQGTPVMIAEGAAKTQLSVRYEEREKKAKKIAVYSKVSTEFLRYLPKLVAFVKNNLMRRMDIVTENQLFNGDDTGENLKGLLSYATTFDGGVGTAAGTGLVGLVPAPNIYDVLRAVALQVQNSYGVPTKIFIKTDLFALMEVGKDSQDRYVLPPFKSANGMDIAGMEIVPTVALNSTSYDFVGGDLSVVNVEFLNQVGIQIGLDGNDFTKNLKTILVEQELVQFVSANDTAVIVKGVYADAKALIQIV